MLFTYLALVGGALGGVYFLLQRAKADKVLSELSRPDHTKEAEEIGKLEQEIEDAKIDYARIRRGVDSKPPSSPGSDPKP